MRESLLFIFGVPLAVYPNYAQGLMEFFRTSMLLAVGYFAIAAVLIAFVLFHLSRKPRTFGRLFLQCWLIAIAFLPGAAMHGGFQVGPLALVLIHSVVFTQFGTIIGIIGFIAVATMIAWLVAMSIHFLSRRRHVV